MDIDLTQLGLLIVQALLITGVLLVFFRARRHLSLCPVYVALGVLQPLQVVLATTVYVQPIAGLAMSPGSVVMFPAALFTLLLVYIREDAREARKVVYGLFLANLVVSVLYLTVRSQLGATGSLNLLDVPIELFDVNARVMITGTLLLFCDAMLVVWLYERLGRFTRLPLFARAFCTLAAVLSFDTVAFAAGTADSVAVALSMIQSGLIGKGAAALFYSGALVLYLRTFERERLPEGGVWRDPFEVLTYRERFERVWQNASVARQRDQARQAQLLRGTPWGIVVLDGDGTITEANPNAGRILGVEADQLVGTVWTEIAMLGGVRDELERIIEATTSGVAEPELVGVLLPLQGSEESSPVRIGARRVEGTETRGSVELIIREESLDGKIRNERQMLQSQLRRAQELQVAGELASGVAHDFNNVLMAITGSSAMVRSEVTTGRLDTSEMLDRLDDVDLVTERAAELVRQLLIFSKVQDERACELDLGSVLTTLERLLRHLVPRSVEFTLKVADDLPHVWIDRVRFEQLVVNLVVNACDAMSDSGQLTVSLESVGGETPGLHLVVEDSGVGMDAATLARATEPFFTTKPSDQGTGLGLANVNAIARDSGGSVSIDSTLGQGTRVTVFLPRFDGALTAQAVDGSDRSGELSGCRILLCEDEELVRRLMERTLEGAGATVVAVGGPLEAMKIAEELNVELDYLVTDAVMPDMNGSELVRRVRLLRPALRAIIVSGYDREVAAPEAGTEPGYAFLAKPFTARGLIDCVQQTSSPPALLR